MNQDFDRDDRRDGERRSFGRRDDDRKPSTQRGDDRPRDNRNDRYEERKPYGKRDDTTRPDRFNRDGDRRSEGGRSNDRPAFRRDGDERGPGNRRDEGNREGGFNRGNDRFGSERRSDDRSSTDRRPYNRDNDRGDRNYNRRDGDSERPRSDRFGSDRPDRSGNDRRNNDRPNRFGNDRRDNDRPNRFGNDRRDNDRPNRFSNERDGDRPDAARPNRFGNERRFDDRRNTGDRPFGGGRSDDRRDNDRRGEDRRGDGRRDDARRDDARPRFSDRNSGASNDRPRREGGFDRNNRRDSDRPRRNDRDEQPLERGYRPRDNEFDKRFSDEQREESRDRRVGKFQKAPDYQNDKAAKPAFAKKGLGKRDDKPRKDAAPKVRKTEDGDERDASGLIRLNRYIANAGVCSRREADELISRGDITVNGNVVTEMGYKVKETDIVKYGKTTLNPEKLVYVLLNKPKDYITTTEDPEERRTVMELVADAGNFRIYPVGRLDRNTTGLLLMTNDGELADKLTHPSNNIRKIYQAELDKPITEEHFEAIQAGVELEDGFIKPDDLALVTPDGFVVGIEIHSGRNRIVRRIFEHFGYEVTKLDRTVYATLTKKELPRGKWRFLEPKEVIKLKYLN